MDLMDLGLEYLERSVHLKNKIQSLLTEYQDASGYKERELKRRLNSLYNDAAECTRIGRMLISYYRRGSKK